MKRILNAKQMKRCDKFTIDSGTPSRELMGRAAAAVFQRITAGDFDLTRVLVLCGTGNNGGDGLALAALLHAAGIDVSYLLCGDESRMSDECAYRLNEAKNAGIPRTTGLDFSGFTLICDALLGIGLSGNVRGTAADMIAAARESGIPSVALDIPSGVNSDTGAVMGDAIPAKLTLAFAYPKPGHIFYPGRAVCGVTEVCDIGVTDSAAGGNAIIAVPEASDILDMLPKRVPDSHKGTYGRLLCVAGSEGMCGAAYLSALGAYRSGIGIAEVFTPSVNVPIIQGRLPEAIATGWTDGTGTPLLRERIRSADACAIGPGLGKSPAAARLVGEVLASDLPAVIDADALNLIASDSALREMLMQRQNVENGVIQKKPTVITPHPAEAARLCDCSVESVCERPMVIASNLSAVYGSVCVLKGAVTVVAEPYTGKVFLNPTGCNGLAKGGSGDVLSGVIGAFLAAGVSPLHAAIAGVYVHGKAGEIASEKMSEYSLLASDVADHIGAAILSLTK